MPFFEPYKDGYVLRIKLTPNAASYAVKGCVCNADGDEYIKISVNAVPEKGKANEELLRQLAKRLKQPKRSLTIISGETDHFKKVYLEIQPSSETDLILADLLRESSK